MVLLTVNQQGQVTLASGNHGKILTLPLSFQQPQAQQTITTTLRQEQMTSTSQGQIATQGQIISVSQAKPQAVSQKVMLQGVQQIAPRPSTQPMNLMPKQHLQLASTSLLAPQTNKIQMSSAPQISVSGTHQPANISGTHQPANINQAQLGVSNPMSVYMTGAPIQSVISTSATQGGVREVMPLKVPYGYIIRHKTPTTTTDVSPGKPSMIGATTSRLISPNRQSVPAMMVDKNIPPPQSVGALTTSSALSVNNQAQISVPMDHQLSVTTSLISVVTRTETISATSPKYASNMTVKSLLWAKKKANRREEQAVYRSLLPKMDGDIEQTLEVDSSVNKNAIVDGVNLDTSGPHLIQKTTTEGVKVIKIPSKEVLDSAVQAVVTTDIKTSLPTANIKVPSPVTMPLIQPRKNVTKTIQSMKGPISTTPKVASMVASIKPTQSNIQQSPVKVQADQIQSGTPVLSQIKSATSLATAPTTQIPITPTANSYILQPGGQQLTGMLQGNTLIQTSNPLVQVQNAGSVLGNIQVQGNVAGMQAVQGIQENVVGQQNAIFKMMPQSPGMVQGVPQSPGIIQTVPQSPGVIQGYLTPNGFFIPQVALQQQGLQTLNMPVVNPTHTAGVSMAPQKTPTLAQQPRGSQQQPVTMMYASPPGVLPSKNNGMAFMLAMTQASSQSTATTVATNSQAVSQANLHQVGQGTKLKLAPGTQIKVAQGSSSSQVGPGTKLQLAPGTQIQVASGSQLQNVHGLGSASSTLLNLGNFAINQTGSLSGQHTTGVLPGRVMTPKTKFQLVQQGQQPQVGSFI